MHSKTYLLFTLFLATTASAEAASEFIGCKGAMLGKTSGKVVDVSQELEAAKKRVTKICEKDLPAVLQNVKDQGSQCIRGNPNPGKAGDNLNVDSYALTSNVEKACKTMKKNLADAAAYCAERSASLKALEAKIKVQGVSASANGMRSEAAQSASLNSAMSTYTESAQTFAALAAKAGKAADAIYATLPDKDENKNARREGNESNDTKDPKLDQLVATLQNSYKAIGAQSSAKAVCEKLASKSGSIEKLAQILKQNLWPNGKRSARSLKVLSFDDTKKSEEYTKLAAQSGERAKNLYGSDISATEPVTAGNTANNVAETTPVPSLAEIESGALPSTNPMGDYTGHGAQEQVPDSAGVGATAAAISEAERASTAQTPNQTVTVEENPVRTTPKTDRLPANQQNTWVWYNPFSWWK